MSIKAGKYRARATEAALGFTATGKEQVAIAFEILDGEFTGQTITWYGYFSELAAKRTMESLRLCGWKTDDVSNLDGVTTNEVEIVVAEEEYNGQTVTKVKWINAPSAGIAMKNRMDAGSAASFAQRMKAMAVQSRMNGGAVTPAPSAVAPRRAAAAPVQRQTLSIQPAVLHGDAYEGDDVPF